MRSPRILGGSGEPGKQASLGYRWGRTKDLVPFYFGFCYGLGTGLNRGALDGPSRGPAYETPAQDYAPEKILLLLLIRRRTAVTEMDSGV